MPLLSPEAQKSLGPFLDVGKVTLAVAGGIAINTLAGGPAVPVISPIAGIIVGVVGGVVILNELKK